MRIPVDIRAPNPDMILRPVSWNMRNAPIQKKIYGTRVVITDNTARVLNSFEKNSIPIVIPQQNISAVPGVPFLLR